VAVWRAGACSHPLVVGVLCLFADQAAGRGALPGTPFPWDSLNSSSARAIFTQAEKRCEV
jgi:N-acetyl-anhydromuramyl-L-alanine amidase AmpD